MTDRDGAGHLDRQEIIIVRRRMNDAEEGHHGGVWKIAFADFMTAMMAFFLVMWLVNASDDATRTQVAQYFNPIKLNDSSPATRGVETSDDGAAELSKEYGASTVEVAGDPNGKPLAGDEIGGEEQAIFRDPYAVLAEIAAEGGAGTSDAGEAGTPDGSGLPGLNGGDAYRDPFDPTSWQLAPNASIGGGKIDEALPPEFKTTIELPAEAAEAEPAESGQGEVDAAGQGEADTAGQQPADATAAEEAAAPEADTAEQRAKMLKSDIEAELAADGGQAPSRLEVTAGKDGVVVSLSDEAASGMFEIGSAKPTPEAVRMMERIAAVLSTRGGTIVIRGHTDARPYTNGDYDNWRLSTARAHMAYYMLVRGGLDESRVTAIEGFADRKLKDPSNPEGAMNRRIEILLTESSG